MEEASACRSHREVDANLSTIGVSVVHTALGRVYHCHCGRRETDDEQNRRRRELGWWRFAWMAATAAEVDPWKKVDDNDEGGFGFVTLWRMRLIAIRDDVSLVATTGSPVELDLAREWSVPAS